LGFRRILLIRRDGIGDMLNTTPAIASLRLSYPDARIVVACSPPQADLLKHNPDVDETIALRGLNFVGKVRRLKPDLAVAAQNAYLCNLTAAFSGARIKLGWKGKRFSSLLSIRVPYRYVKGEVHEAQRNLDLIAEVCDRLAPLRLKLALREEERETGMQEIIRAGIDPRRPWCAIHPGGSSWDKLWPPDGFARIGERLSERYGMQVAIIFGPGEEGIAGEIASQMRIKPALIQPENVRRLAAVIAHVPLFICNDSGPMHIAAALEVPTLAIFGPTDHVRWRPLSEKAKVIRRDLGCFPCSAHKCRRGYECIKKLPVDLVWKGLEEMLEDENIGVELLTHR